MKMDGAYEVRQSRILTGLTLALYSALPMTAVVIGLQDLSERYMFFIIGLGFEATMLALMRGRVGRAVRQELLFAVDEQGVYLGPDEYGRPAMREPWSQIDFIVHFKGSIWKTSTRPNPNRNVGIARGGRIITSRATGGWRFSVRRAAAAADRFGGGKPVLRGPYFDQVPREWFHTLTLPPAWLATHAAPGGVSGTKR
ncbi:hypothetical protein ACIA3K_05950 [Micromonospora sp. NPDC051543]|uniref:hypothetical protein n=1 Tax=Micromonospora sp. NPDC051543 TaxID=3364287 RepID=UPI0037A562D3